MQTQVFEPGAAGPAMDGPLLSGERPPAIHHLSRRHKAAVVVRLLLTEGVDLSLTNLPQDQQRSLTRAMADLRGVDRHTLEAVVKEFAQALDGLALTFPSDLDGALRVLDGRISPATADGLRREITGDGPSDSWTQLQQLAPERLAALLEEESVEVGAILLSKLPVKLAADLLGRLEGRRARAITLAVSRTGSVAPEVVDRIGEALSANLGGNKAEAFSDRPVTRVGAILDGAAARTREDLLHGLDEDDADFAQSVRRAIFTFADIPDRLPPQAVSRVVRDIEQNRLAMALGAALETEGKEAIAAEFLLDNLPQRMATQLRDAVEDAGNVRQVDGENAMREVITTVRQLETEGELSLIEREDEAA